MQLGELYLEAPGGAKLLGPLQCLGIADRAQATERGNPERNPKLPFGNTPLGVYQCWIGQAQPTRHNLHAYGPHPFISLDPIGGVALTAKKNGRFGLLIHGGASGTRAWHGIWRIQIPEGVWYLRPTFGCVRLSDPDMERLQAAIQAQRQKEQAGVTIQNLTCEIEERRL